MNAILHAVSPLRVTRRELAASVARQAAPGSPHTPEGIPRAIGVMPEIRDTKDP